MNKKNIELLIIDLCARLHYGVMVHFDGNANIPRKLTSYDSYGSEIIFSAESFSGLNAEEIKPYLRPISSMTEEERKEYTSLCNRQDIDTPTWSKIIWHDTYKSIDWLNKKMFAYRTIDGKDMFELGFALEAPEGMYKL